MENGESAAQRCGLTQKTDRARGLSVKTNLRLWTLVDGKGGGGGLMSENRRGNQIYVWGGPD